MIQLTNRQKEIIQNSLEIISGNGIRSLTIKNIARRMEFTEAAVYRHFKSKDDILGAIINLYKESSSSILIELKSSENSSIEKIKEFFLGRCKIFAENKDLSIILISDDVFLNNTKLSEMNDSLIQEHKKILIQILDNGQKNGEIRNDIEIEHLFMMIFGTLRLYIRKWRHSGFKFNILKEGRRLWDSLETILNPSQL